jgi:hypothetical protein
MEVMVPGQRATVEVALACTVGIPRATRAGKVTSVPPPATAFMAAPTAAARATRGRRRVWSTSWGGGA